MNKHTLVRKKYKIQATPKFITTKSTSSKATPRASCAHGTPVLATAVGQVSCNLLAKQEIGFRVQVTLYKTESRQKWPNQTLHTPSLSIWRAEETQSMEVWMKNSWQMPTRHCSWPYFSPWLKRWPQLEKVQRTWGNLKFSGGGAQADPLHGI